MTTDYISPEDFDAQADDMLRDFDRIRRKVFLSLESAY